MAATALLAVAAICAFAQEPPPELREAIAKHQAGDVRAALPLYRAFLAKNPASADGLVNYGAALAHEGQFKEAVAAYEKALRVQPGNPQALLNLGLTFYKTGRYPEAKERFQTVHPLLPKMSPPDRQISFLLADCEIRLGNYSSAVELLDPWDRQTPDDPALAYLLGTALIRGKQTARGEVVIDRILRKGESAEAHLLLGTAHLNSLDFTAARDDFEKAVALNPKLQEANASLGLALLGLSQADAAADAFRKEIAIDPNNFAAVLQSGILAKQNQSFPEARQFLRRALALRPRDAGVRYQLATVEIAAGGIEEGRRQLESLIKDHPDFLEAHVSLSSAYYRLKRKEDGDRERAIVRRLTAEAQAKQQAAQIPRQIP